MASFFIIKGRLDGLNEYTKANRGNKYGGNSMKRRNEQLVINAIQNYKIKKEECFPISLSIYWYEPNQRRDIDNITFATKFIQDALVRKGIIPDDSQKYICRLKHIVQVDKDNPRIEVIIGNE